MQIEIGHDGQVVRVALRVPTQKDVLLAQLAEAQDPMPEGAGPEVLGYIARAYERALAFLRAHADLPPWVEHVPYAEIIGLYAAVLQRSSSVPEDTVGKSGARLV